MSKFPLFILFILGLLILCVESSFLLRSTVIKPPAAIPVPVARPDSATLTHIRIANQVSAGVSSLACSDVDVTLTQRITFHLKGSIYYEKPKNFRMILSLQQPEVDIGSNNTLFWYWSLRMKPPGVYYCDHEHIAETRLRSVFNPMWMMECLGFGNISERVGAALDGGQLRVAEQQRGLTRTTIINLQNHLPVEHLLQQQNQIIATSTVREWQQIGNCSVPKTLELVWYEEGTKLIIKLNSPVINCKISPTAWEMPNRAAAINLVGY